MNRMLSAALLLSMNCAVIAMSVEDAYHAVPHKRTPYTEVGSTQDSETRRFLDALFTRTDQALIQRIKAMQGEFNTSEYRLVVDNLKSITAPNNITKAHQLIIAAVEEHFRYFELLEKQETDSRLIISSHKKLISAYNILMEEINESRSNKIAFFDHLCALDFI